MKFIGFCLTAMALTMSATAGNIEKKLLKAVLAGDTDKVEALIARGADVNHTIAGNESLLICASERGFYDVAQVLLEHGADINHQTKKGENALLRATKYGRYQVAKDLISQGIDMAVIPKKSTSPLHHAVERLDFSMIRLLLKNGANVNQKNHEGRSPLHLAATIPNPIFIETLLTMNPEVNLKDKSGETPLLVAVENNHSLVVKRLLQYGADPALANRKGKNARNLAATWNTDIVQLLKDPANIKNEAIAHRPFLDLEAVKQFTKDGHKVNEASKRGATILFYAVEHGELETVLYLIENGADVNKADVEGVTPLMVAVINGRTAVAELLIDKGADPNALSKNGFSSLYLAGFRQDKHLAMTLMNNGGYRVAKLFEDYIELPPKKMRYRRLNQQVKWLPNLTRASYTVSQYVKQPIETKYPEAFNIAGRKGKDMEPPIFIKKVRPKYPETALKSRISGYVVLQAVLTRSGKVDEIRVLRAMGNGRYGFEIAAIESLSQWTFKPGKVDGENTDIRMTMKIDFTLR